MSHSFLNEGSRPFYTHFTCEHEAIDGAIHELQRDLNDANKKLPTSQIAGRLIQLREMMSRHFLEEEEGCFDEICARQPHMCTETKQLEQTHKMLLEIVDELISDVDEANSGSVWLTRFNRFEHTMMAHEKEERTLVRRGLMLPEEDA